MKQPLSLEPDTEVPTRFLVKDADDVFVGAIDQIGANEWQNSHVADGKPLSPVPVGPFQSKEAAFEAYQRALSST